MPPTDSATLYTIGHSTRTADEFTALLQESAIRMVVDVRAFPRSRTNPQFNSEALAASLAAVGIGYEHIAELGGRRRRPPGAPASPNSFWRNESFRNYADYTATDAFHAGLNRLGNLARSQRCAIMCSETLWWRCHRRIISDYLLADGSPVLHILGSQKIEPATLTPTAHRQSNGTLVYRA